MVPKVIRLLSLHIKRAVDGFSDFRQGYVSVFYFLGYKTEFFPSKTIPKI